MNLDNLTRDEARERAKIIRNPHYVIDLDLTEDSSNFRSHTTIRFDAEPGTDTFADLTEVVSATATLNGLPCEVANHRIQLRSLQEKNELVVDATLKTRRTGTGMHLYRDSKGERWLYTQFEPFDAHAVFACFDQPDLKATYEVKVSAPENWKVRSNAVPTKSENGRWEFETTRPLSTYLVCVIAGAYEVTQTEHNGTPMALWARPELFKHLDAQQWFETTSGGLDWFPTAFGQAYPFGNYDQLVVPEFKFGAMEHPGAVTFTENYIFRSEPTTAWIQRRAETILHEMAHMWFGNLVTMRWWDDLWLNESFATYASFLAMEETTNLPAPWADFNARLKNWAYAEDQLPSTHAVATDARDINDVHLNFDGISYAKGASLLKQFVSFAGREAFMEGCRRYFATNAWKNAELKDFIGAVEEASGRDLSKWSEQWLTTTGVPLLSVEGDMLTAGGEGGSRTQRIGVAVYDEVAGKLQASRTVEFDTMGPNTPLAGLRQGRGLVVPNHDDMGYARVRLDPDSLEMASERLSDISDAVDRSVIWGALWDQMRSAALSASRFLDIFGRHIATEDAPGVLTLTTARAVTTLAWLTRDDEREVLRSSFAARMLEIARASEDREIKLVTAAAYMATAALPDESTVRGFLNGVDVFNGVPADSDRRWAAVQALACMGASDTEELIRAELANDPTESGTRAGEIARAAFPQTASKVEAWDRISSDERSTFEVRSLSGSEHMGHVLEGRGNLSMNMGRGIISPWHPGIDPDYTARYFATITDYWDRRGAEHGMTFTKRLFPVWDRASIALATAIAESTDETPLRRLMVEGASQARMISDIRDA